MSFILLFVWPQVIFCIKSFSIKLQSLEHLDYFVKDTFLIMNIFFFIIIKFFLLLFFFYVYNIFFYKFDMSFFVFKYFFLILNVCFSILFICIKCCYKRYFFAWEISFGKSASIIPILVPIPYRVIINYSHLVCYFNINYT